MIEGDDKVALFSRFTYRSTTLGKAATSPFAILARVTDGRVTYPICCAPRGRWWCSRRCALTTRKEPSDE